MEIEIAEWHQCLKKPKAQTKRIFPKNQETEDEELKCTKIKILFFCCSLNGQPPNVELGDDMIIPLDTDLDDDWTKMVRSGRPGN